MLKLRTLPSRGTAPWLPVFSAQTRGRLWSPLWTVLPPGLTFFLSTDSKSFSSEVQIDYLKSFSLKKNTHPNKTKKKKKGEMSPPALLMAIPNRYILYFALFTHFCPITNIPWVQSVHCCDGTKHAAIQEPTASGRPSRTVLPKHLGNTETGAKNAWPRTGSPSKKRELEGKGAACKTRKGISQG